MAESERERENERAIMVMLKNLKLQIWGKTTNPTIEMDSVS